MSKRRFSAIALVTLLSSPALAEVRLSGSAAAPELSITPTVDGVWSTVSGRPELVLNAGGDALGDGAPAQARRPGGLLAAWQRPVTGTVELALAGAGAWRVRERVAAPHGFGTPKVAALKDGWLVAYTIDPEQPTIVIAGVTPGGRATLPFRLIDGLLVDVVVVDESIHVLGISVPDLPIGVGRTVKLEVTTVSPGTSVPGASITIRRTSTVEIESISFPDLPIGIGRFTVPSSPITAGRTRGTGLPGFPASLGGMQDVQAHQGERADRSRYALSTWWRGPYAVRFVELDQIGAVLPVEQVSRRTLRPYDDELVRDAVRLVEGR